MMDYIWDHRFPNEKDHFKSEKQKKKQLQKWRRNETMLREYREGLSILDLSKKYGLSEHWTKLVLKREGRLQDVLSSIPSKKVTIADLGPFSWRTTRCLSHGRRRCERKAAIEAFVAREYWTVNDNLLNLTIEEFYQSQNARSLLQLPNFGIKSLHEIALCLNREGYDIAKFKPNQPALAWIGDDHRNG
jgi:hypothetical protein